MPYAAFKAIALDTMRRRGSAADTVHCFFENHRKQTFNIDNWGVEAHRQTQRNLKAMTELSSSHNIRKL